MENEENDKKRNGILDKLKKLFALGQSSNQYEAELALSKANKIMTEHQISSTEIDLADEGSVIREEIILEDGRRAIWLCTLADSCAMLYDARAYYCRAHRGPGMKLIFYGIPSDILAAQMTLQHLYSSWKSIVQFDLREHAPDDKRSFKRSHGSGFSRAIYSRAKSLVEQRQSEVKSATGRDLVLVKSAALDDFMKDIKIKSTKTAPIQRNAYAIGFDQGNAIPFNALDQQEPIASIGYNGAQP